VLQSGQETEYEDADSVRQAIFNMVGDQAIGREGYSDRGAEATNDESENEERSI